MKKITLLFLFAMFNLVAFGQDLTCDDGVFLDSGGDAAPYSNDEVTTTVISSPDNVVTITFTFVDIESSTGNGSQDGCWDFLTIYDGPDTSSPVLAQTLCGEESGDGGVPSVDTSLLSVGDSFTSTHSTGALTIVFTSDGSVTEEGWSADTTCESLSIGEQNISDFKMFPNPANDVLNISAAVNLENAKIYNLVGQLVVDQKIGSLSDQINVSQLKTGIYILEVASEGGVGTYKFVKE